MKSTKPKRKRKPRRPRKEWADPLRPEQKHPKAMKKKKTIKSSPTLAERRDMSLDTPLTSCYNMFTPLAYCVFCLTDSNK